MVISRTSDAAADVADVVVVADSVWCDRRRAMLADKTIMGWLEA